MPQSRTAFRRRLPEGWIWIYWNNCAIDRELEGIRALRLSNPSGATGALASLGGAKGGFAMRLLFPLRAA